MEMLDSVLVSRFRFRTGAKGASDGCQYGGVTSFDEAGVGFRELVSGRPGMLRGFNL